MASCTACPRGQQEIVLVVYWHRSRPDTSRVPRIYRLTGSSLVLRLEEA